MTFLETKLVLNILLTIIIVTVIIIIVNIIIFNVHNICNLTGRAEYNIGGIVILPAGIYLLKDNNRNTNFQHVIASWVGLNIVLFDWKNNVQLLWRGKIKIY